MAKTEHEGHEMDIREFEKLMPPKAKRSKLEPYQAQIFELKSKGYANWQVCEWLSKNGVKVSQEGLRKFTKSREAGTVAAAPPATGPAQQPSEETSPAGDDLAGLDAKQKREQLAKRFIKDEPTNPLLKRIKDKKQ